MNGSRQWLLYMENDPAMTIKDTNIKGVEHLKILGVIVDDQLLWNRNITNIATNVCQGIATMK